MGGHGARALEAAPAAERLESMDTECIALSDDLVVEIRGVLHGDLDLKLTIRMSDESGDAHEVCDDAFELAACHPTPEEMSSDAVSDPPAGAALGNPRAVSWADEETSGDGREVRAEIISNARTMVDAGSAADTPIDAYAGASRDSIVAAPRLELADILTNQADGISSPDVHRRRWNWDCLTLFRETRYATPGWMVLRRAADANRWRRRRRRAPRPPRVTMWPTRARVARPIPTRLGAGGAH